MNTDNYEKLNKYITPGCPCELVEYIRRAGYNPIEVAPISTVHSPIAVHPDIQMCRLGISDNSPVVMAQTEELALMSETYPSDIAFNAACTGKYFIHNLRYTNQRLLSCARENDMELIDVKQGYSKCSIIVVDENSIITYDRGIASACSKTPNLEVLLVSPGFIELEGYDTGFIGGTSGRIRNVIVFNGNLLSHPDGRRIKEFIESRGLSCKWFDWPLTDIGSII